MLASRTPWAVAIGTALLALGCSSGASPSASEASDLIGGTPADAEELPSTVDIADGCTGAKIAARFILTAAHCAVNPSTMDPKYGPDRPVGLARRPSAGHVEHAVVRVHVHPDWATKCAETLCSIAAVAARVDAPDVALIELADELDGVPNTPVDPRALAPGEAVTLVGFGCTEGVHVGGRSGEQHSLRLADAAIVDPSAALHDGSPVKAVDIAVFSGNYALTLGPGSAPSHAGLCPGDSGGPLYAKRGGTLRVVGVNANYTLSPDEDDAAGLPVTNWHTRVDGASKHGVFAWLDAVVH